MKNSVLETVIGAVVIAIAIAFFVYAYRTGDLGKGSGGYPIKAQFERVDGISRGSDVRMSGIKIGSVTALRLDPKSFEAVITMQIDRAIKLPEDSTAKVTSEGLLGGKFVSLEPGGSETILDEGGLITNTQSALDIFSLIGQAIFGKDNKNTTPAPENKPKPAE